MNRLHDGRRPFTRLVALCLLVFTACSDQSRAAVATATSSAFEGVLLDTDSVRVAQMALAKCTGLTERATCYEEMLFSLAKTDRVRLAMGALHIIGMRDPDVARNGHQYTHGIGIAAFAAGDDVAAVFASCSLLYQSGCYHGVIQAYFANSTSVDTGTVRELCDDYLRPGADQWLRFQCVHGMGHGLTMFYSRHLLRALEGCDLLAEQWDRESCYGGAFMENIVGSAAHSHHAAPTLAPSHDHAAMSANAMRAFQSIDPKDPHYPCSIVGERYLDACYGMQSGIILPMVQRDYGAAAKVCDSAPQRQRPICYQSLGTNAAGESTGDDARAIALCTAGGAPHQPWCFYGAVRNRINVSARAEDGLGFCDQIPDVRNALKCYEGIGEEVAVLQSSRETREALCANVPTGNKRAACRYGARTHPVPPLGLPRRAL